MSATTRNAPLTLATRAHAELRMSDAERELCRNIVVPDGESPNRVQSTCQIPVRIGVFFDGTNNNRDRDEDDRAHSNVVRLFNMHPSMDGAGPLQRVGHYSIYIPGVGTRFEENAEFKESQDGKAAGKGGQARILFGVIQVFNSIHRAFSNQAPLFSKQEVEAELRRYAKEVEMVGAIDQGDRHERPRPTRNRWLKEFNQDIGKKISAARQDAPLLPYVPEVFVSVFGFSRGAAEAAAFCHWLHAAMPDGRVAGIPVRLGFAGLFDCVASVGIADSARRVAPFMGVMDGHFAWASEILSPLPMVQKVVHMVAAHEQRMNFPLTRVAASDLSELVYPGVHSDVGGGYGPNAQGRSPNDADLLSQVPLLHMHRAARAAGVPLMQPEDVPDKARDYDFSPALAKAWNAYMEALSADYCSHPNRSTSPGPAGVADCQDFATLVQHHMRLYYAMRCRYMGDMDQWIAAHDLQLSAQDKEDLVSYDKRLLADYMLFDYVRDEHAKRVMDKDRNDAALVREFRAKFPQLKPNLVLAYMLSWGPGLPAVERDWLDKVMLPVLAGYAKVRDLGYETLLGRYVHDSLAGFYLAGYSSLEEKSDKLMQVLEMSDRGQQLNSHEQQLLVSYQQRAAVDPELQAAVGERFKQRRALQSKSYRTTSEKTLALEQFDRERVFQREENQTVMKSGVFPPAQTDEDADLLVDGVARIAIQMITDGRREGGGYLLPRAIFQATGG